MAIKKLDHGKYQVRVSTGYHNGKQQRKSITVNGSLADAKAQEKKLKAAIEAGKVSTSKKSITVVEMMTNYGNEILNQIRRGNLHESHYYNTFRSANNEVGRSFHRRYVSDLTTDDVQKWIDGLTDRVSAKTVYNYYVEFKKAFELAVRDGHIRSTVVVDNVILPKKSTGSSRIGGSKAFTLEQIHAIMDKIEQTSDLRVKTAAMIAMFCGLRKSEIIGLNIDDIDMDAGLITVRRAGHMFNKKIILDAPKSETSYREVGAPDILIDTIKQLLALYDEEKTQYRKRWTNTPALLKTGIRSKHGPGNRMRPDFLRKTFKQLLLDAGINENGKSLHAARHSFASLMIAEGINIQEVSEALGHKNILITADVYAHEIRRQQANTANLVANKMFKDNNDNETD